MNQLSKLWISISIALGIAQISQASILQKTLVKTGQQTRTLSAFHDAMCRQAKKDAHKLGKADSNNQTYNAILKAKKAFNGTDVISQLQAFVYWQQLLEHKTYQLAALAKQDPASKIFINSSKIDPNKFDDINLRSIIIVQDCKQRITTVSVATMCAEQGKILIEEQHQETEFKN